MHVRRTAQDHRPDQLVDRQAQRRRVGAYSTMLMRPVAVRSETSPARIAAAVGPITGTVSRMPVEQRQKDRVLDAENDAKADIGRNRRVDDNASTPRK